MEARKARTFGAPIWKNSMCSRRFGSFIQTMVIVSWRWSCIFFKNDDRVAMVNSLSVLGLYLILMSQDVHFKMHWGID